MTPVSRLFVSLVFLVSSFFPATAQQQYTITDIGNLGGYYGGYATAINSRGDIAGISGVDHNIEGGINHGFYWSKSTGIVDLGSFSDWSEAFAINRSGTVVGWSDSNFNIFLTSAFHWTKDGGIRPLTGMSAYVGDAHGINDTGQVVGGAWVSKESQHAYRLTGMVMEDLGTLGGKNSGASAINSHGEVVGAAITQAGPNIGHAFLWQEGSGMKDLGALPGDSISDAAAINNLEQVVGTSSSISNPNRAFLWTKDRGMKQIGTKPDFPNNPDCIPRGINDSGQAVGEADSRAYVWTKAAGMHDLNKLIPPNTGWVLWEAWAINNAGQIVGKGYIGHNPDAHAFLLTPVK